MEERKELKSAQELRELLGKDGIMISEEKAQKYYDAYKAHGEIGDDELDSVSGGGCYTKDGHLLTTVGYGCMFYEKEEDLGGVDGTCYCCKYWHRDNATGFTLVGSPLKCDHPKNIRK